MKKLNIPPAVWPFLLITVGLLALGVSFVAYRIFTFRPALPTRSPLAQAVRDGDAEKVRTLLRAGADANSTMDATYRIGPGGTIESSMEIPVFGKTTPEVGMPVLCAAAMDGHAEIIRLLLAKGPDINRPDKYGQTPLIFAAWFGDVESVKLLLSKHADKTVRDHSGKTALAWAQTEANMAASDVLKQAGAKE